MDKRGSRRKSSARKQRAARAAADKPQGRLQRWIRRLLVWGGAIALLGALFIALAVAFAARSMPSYYQLKATQTAQTIVVRARDGTAPFRRVRGVAGKEVRNARIFERIVSREASDPRSLDRPPCRKTLIT